LYLFTFNFSRTKKTVVVLGFLNFDKRFFLKIKKRWKNKKR